MKKKLINILLVVGILCFTIFVINRFLLGDWKSHNLDRYIEISNYQSALPKIEELGEYKELEFMYYRKNSLMFFSDAYSLKISYNSETYEKEKENIQQNYVYETEKLLDVGGYEKEPYFEMDTYDFKVFSPQKYDLMYPHEIIFVGTSDEKKEIVIVYYWDTDLDYIDVSFPQFLRSECGWE